MASARLRPQAPRLGAAAREAAVDFYFNSWRLVPANLVWGAGFILLLLAAAAWPAAVLASPLLALPTVGIFRLAALIARGGSVALSDGFDAWRRFGARALAVGAALLLCFAMFGTNVVLGLLGGGVVGWSLATLAAWGLAAAGVSACVLWPLLVDPRREGTALRETLRLGLLLVVAFPLRFGALALLVGAILAASTVAFAAIATVSVSYVALVAARYVLPAADRFSPPPDSVPTAPGA